jgi:hypothetical protein
MKLKTRFIKIHHKQNTLYYHVQQGINICGEKHVHVLP